MNFNKKFKVEQSRDFYEALIVLIEQLMLRMPDDNDDKLHLSALCEVLLPLKKKLLNYQSKYTHSFTPTQAIALHILFCDFISDHTSFMGNALHKISQKIHQQYQ